MMRSGGMGVRLGRFAQEGVPGGLPYSVWSKSPKTFQKPHANLFQIPIPFKSSAVFWFLFWS